MKIADTGTLFLDEIGDLSLEKLKPSSWTFLEQRTFRRGLGHRAAQGRRAGRRGHPPDLRAMAASKEFRGDLLFRLNAMTVELPPLRERPDDTVLLAEHFLLAANQEYRKAWQGLRTPPNRC